MAHPLAGKPAPKEILVDVERLLAAYASERPDPSNPLERVAFGTSGHRGSSLRRSFNEAHILAVTQAVCEHRAAQGITGPLPPRRGGPLNTPPPHPAGGGRNKAPPADRRPRRHGGDRLDRAARQRA